MRALAFDDVGENARMYPMNPKRRPKMTCVNTDDFWILLIMISRRTETLRMSAQRDFGSLQAEVCAATAAQNAPGPRVQKAISDLDSGRTLDTDDRPARRPARPRGPPTPPCTPRPPPAPCMAGRRTLALMGASQRGSSPCRKASSGRLGGIQPVP